MKLFAVKCDTGYLRQTDSGCELVELHKASVFPDVERANKVLQSNPSFPNVRVIEITLTEKELQQN